MANSFIALLRGVMPTGKNKVPMARLRETVSAAGYEKVRTYIQSGNLLLESSKSRQETAEHLRRLIREQIGPDLPVILRTPQEIQKALDENPFNEGFLRERVFYVFPETKIAEETLAELAARDFGEDLLRAGDGVLYLYIPGSAARTKLNNNFLERACKTACTTRNRNTLEKLVELSQEG